ncbi:hypothetical protein SDRG_16598 [Saprolegnia diclina VS20]|uniref:Metallo-beta-lactamase domain-containing protein n=1 Tax=Saprolegnia diclina (strain VS20) TaxID=1156394 RepID=T0PTI9_SAPDV|nr:hypothetical protein SDRG_16598 [Saprolegnia diclina VS20]EQC25541.1 hypothetical protein SDRG_16598 [Saprolegnia diclina VS20]|eukprot:XP_008621036.1 hypothetical protein SDRG_16598 [Saprolegnia diclina VS20]
MNPLTALLTLMAAAATSATTYCGDSALKLTSYNPGASAIFPVSSFGKSQAQAVVDLVKASGKHLTTIYVSHGDPDYYFGLDTIRTAFPDAAIVATAPVVEHIKETVDAKLKAWAKDLGADAPAKTIIPDVLKTDKLTLEGHSLEIRGPAARSYVWIDDLKAVVGGVLIENNIHAFMADTQTPESHTEWLNALTEIQALKPSVISCISDAAPAFTAKYIRDFDMETTKAKNSTDLIAAMTALYPKAGSVISLQISAQVAKGEMPWP